MSTKVVAGRREGHYILPAVTEPFEPNQIDYRHSVVKAGKRADAGDETLEICPHCCCEVDVDPQPHQPGCPGIGAPHATPAGMSSATSKMLARAEEARGLKPVGGRPPVRTGSSAGLDALERMDAGEPQDPDVPGTTRDDPEPPDDDEGDADGAALEEETAVGDPAVTGSAPAPHVRQREPVRAASSSSAVNPYGLKKFGRGFIWTREAAIAAVKAFAAEHGRPPRVADFKDAGPGTLPSNGSACQLFGEWTTMVVAAGLEPAKTTVPRTPRSRGRAAVPDSPPPSEAPDQEEETSSEAGGSLVGAASPSASDAALHRLASTDPPPAVGDALHGLIAAAHRVLDALEASL